MQKQDTPKINQIPIQNGRNPVKVASRKGVCRQMWQAVPDDNCYNPTLQSYDPTPAFSTIFLQCVQTISFLLEFESEIKSLEMASVITETEIDPQQVYLISTIQCNL